MKYKKSVQERQRFIIPVSWEKQCMEIRGLDRIIDHKPIRHLRSNQLKTYYKRKLDGLGWNVAKLRSDIMIDLIDGIERGALDETLFFNGVM